MQDADLCRALLMAYVLSETVLKGSLLVVQGWTCDRAPGCGCNIDLQHLPARPVGLQLGQQVEASLISRRLD